MLLESDSELMFGMIFEVKRLATGIIILVLLVGMGLTVWDWREWKRLETERFGQGWADLQAEAMPLTVKYRNQELRIIAKLPMGLTVGEQIKFEVGSDKDIGVTTWDEELPGGRLMIKQRLGKSVGDKIVVVETTFGEEGWGKWEKTIQAIFESVEGFLN